MLGLPQELRKMLAHMTGTLEGLILHLIRPRRTFATTELLLVIQRPLLGLASMAAVEAWWPRGPEAVSLVRDQGKAAN